MEKRKENENLVLENAILMSADIFQKLHKMRGEENVFETAEIIADEARNFENKLCHLQDGTYDYLEELEKHEKWVIDKWTQITTKNIRL